MRGIVPIALAILACGCGGGYDSGGSSAPACSAAIATATTQVDIQGMSFVPSCIKVAAGAVVTFTNKDAVEHTATADGGSFDTGGLLMNQSSAKTLAAAGTFPYHCTVHPGMRATVIVQ